MLSALVSRSYVHTKVEELRRYMRHNIDTVRVRKPANWKITIEINVYYRKKIACTQCSPLPSGQWEKKNALIYVLNFRLQYASHTYSIFNLMMMVTSFPYSCRSLATSIQIRIETIYAIDTGLSFIIVQLHLQFHELIYNWIGTMNRCYIVFQWLLIYCLYGGINTIVPHSIHKLVVSRNSHSTICRVK